ncbi:mitochondrial cardiolipin hydrolase [Drosophila bipectinata]|uniref:mitochondrial cardiolipin hydrolase n=1 Tax=Drosophila bipectinata TaxID=42026 RepID=UPI001C89036F|nr:mitochondrial cardiolipin hydrolase [Drosophila bipectinata]
MTFLIDFCMENSTWIKIAIGALATEVIWIFLQSRKKLSPKTKNRLNKVVICSELSETCAHYHIRHRKPGSSKKCGNNYCSLKNIDAIVEVIDKALYSIDIAIYAFTAISISKAFERAMHRGVKLRIISDKEMTTCGGSQVAVLSLLDVPVRTPDTKFMMHHKFFIIDAIPRVEEIRRQNNIKIVHPPCSVLATGSCNWTKQAFSYNWENILITEDADLTARYHTEFSRMWDSCENPTKVPAHKQGNSFRRWISTMCNWLQRHFAWKLGNVNNSPPNLCNPKSCSENIAPENSKNLVAGNNHQVSAEIQDGTYIKK